MKGTLFDIQKGSTVDGPGIRTTVFFMGCNLRCAWCHNPESQTMQTKLLIYQDRCTHCGLCKEVCPNHLEKCDLCGSCAKYCPQEARKLCGKAYTVEEVCKKILSDKVYYAASGGGATFSGGECMLQPQFLLELLRLCHENGVHTAVDTAGNVPFAVFEKILPYTDMFLYDIKSMDSALHKRYTGADNALLLSNLAKLLQMRKRVWIRVPIVPGVNDSEKEMLRIRAFLLQNGYPEKVELLPYHRMGEAKYKAMGCSYTAFSVPTKETIDTLQKIIAP